MNKKAKIILLIAALLIAAAALAAGTVHVVRRIRDGSKNQLTFEQYYAQKVAAFEDENAATSSVDVVFLGDSLTDGCDVKKYYPDYSCLNRGISGDTTVGLQKRLKVSVLDVDCKAIVMLIGANNMDTMLDNYEEILRTLAEEKPQTPVILLSLSAMGSDWADKNRLAQNNNKTIAALAEKYGFIFLDIFTPLMNPETGAIYDAYTTDGGHWTPEGYAVVTGLVNQQLTKMIEAKD